MPRIRRSLSTMIVAGALIAPVYMMPAAHAAQPATPASAVSAKLASSQHAMSVDGVALTVMNPDMPAGASFTPKPGDSVQSASAEATGPFRFFSITAVPYGEQLPKSEFPVAASGGAVAWRQIGGPATPGPVATLFGQKITAQVRHETDGTSKLQTLQWIVEAGNRIWIVRAEHAEPDVPAAFGTGIAVSATNLTTPTTINVTTANAATHPHTAQMATATTTATTAGDAAISVGTLAPVPSSYWNHGDGTCDGGFDSLLNEKIDGLQVCGYSNGNDRLTGLGSNEWECAELPMRYAIQRWGLNYNDGGDGKDQADNLTSALNQIHPGRFVLRGNSLSDHTAPQAGDVIAFYNSGAGHTGVVLASHVDASGNGTIDMVHQNWNEVPSTPGEWDGITVSNGIVEDVVNGGDVHWMHDTSSDVAPSVSAPGGLTNGGTYHGTVTVTGTSSQTATNYYLHLQQGGVDKFVSHPAIAGGTSFSYAFDTTQVPDGTYQALTGAVINGTAYYSPAITITIANIPNPPSVSITGPAAGSSVSGTTTISASVSDTTSGASFSTQFYVDGAAYGAPVAGANPSIAWDSTTVPSGAHTLGAISTASNGGGVSGNGVASGVPVTVVNASLLQLHNDGSIYLHSGATAAGWSQIGNNVASKQIAASNNGAVAYELDTTGSIWRWTSAGWSSSPIDTNAATMQIAASNNLLYQLHSDGSIFQYTPGVNANWTQIGNNVAAVKIAATNDGSVYELDNTGTIWRYSSGAWTQLDNNTATVAIAVGNNANSFYQLHSNGSIFQYTPGVNANWTQIGNNVAAVSIAAGTTANVVYELDNTGTIWQDNNGTWTQLDTNAAAKAIQVGDDGTLYQLHSDGSIFQYTPGVNANWTQLDDNGSTIAIAAGATRSVHR